MRDLNTIGAVAAVVVGMFAMSYMAERPKYQFEEVAKRVGQELPGARLIQQVKAGDLTSPITWVWPPTLHFTYAMPELMQDRFYLMALRYNEKEPTVYLVDADCKARDVSLYDLSQPESAYPARDVFGEPVQAPNGKTYRLVKHHFAAPPEWLRAFCDTNWTSEREAAVRTRRAQLRRERERVWIVVDMEMPSGQPAQMAFDNPKLPDLTLEECKSGLHLAMPSLKAAVDAEPRLRGNRIKSASCVKSVEDPIKPKS